MNAQRFTGYMLFTHAHEGKSKIRYDLKTGRNVPKEFETDLSKKDGKTWVYLREHPEINVDWRRVPEQTLLNRRAKFVAQVFRPSPDHQEMGYGILGKDALLFLFGAGAFEVFILQNCRYQVRAIFNLFTDGLLNARLAEQRKKVKKSAIQPELF